MSSSRNWNPDTQDSQVPSALDAPPATGPLSTEERERLESCFNAGAARLPADDEHWIHGHDEGLSYCYGCATAKVAELLKLEPEADYSVDGGWRTENDSTPFCEVCHKLLDASLTAYGCEAEVDHFLANGFDAASDDDCRAMSEVISSMGWEPHYFEHESVHQKQKRAEYFTGLHTLCRKILAQLEVRNAEAPHLTLEEKA